MRLLERRRVGRPTRQVGQRALNLRKVSGHLHGEAVHNLTFISGGHGAFLDGNQIAISGRPPGIAGQFEMLQR